MTLSDRPVILITGCGGLLGSAIVPRLSQDHRVVGLEKDVPGGGGDDWTSEVDWISCDLTDGESLRRALERVRDTYGDEIASVIHLAAYYDFSGASSPLYEELTVDGTRRLLEHLESFELDQLVFSSTLLVHAPSEDGAPLDESSPLEALWDYPRSKIRAEEVIREARGCRSVILRIAGAYDDDGHSPPLTQQLWRIHEKSLESYVFPGDSTRGQSFVHVEDVADGFRRVVDRRAELDPQEVFLLGEPEVVSYGELQARAGELIHGREWPALRIPKPVAKAGAWVKDRLTPDEEQFIQPWMVDLADAHYPISIEKARRKLGWTPRHRLRDALPRMVRKLLDDPVAWCRENGLPVPSVAARSSNE